MPAPLYLLDTCVLVQLVRGKALGRHIEERFGLRQTSVRPLVCIVTHGEIRSFARYNKWGDKKITALKSALDQLVTVDISNQGILDAYVEIDFFSRRPPVGSARKMGKNDLWIAAVANATQATLLTTDKDFDHLPPDLINRERIDPTVA